MSGTAYATREAHRDVCEALILLIAAYPSTLTGAQTLDGSVLALTFKIPNERITVKFKRYWEYLTQSVLQSSATKLYAQPNGYCRTHVIFPPGGTRYAFQPKRPFNEIVCDIHDFGPTYIQRLGMILADLYSTEHHENYTR